MGRSSTFRTSKYASKLDGDVAKSRVKTYGHLQKMNFRLAVDEQVAIEQEVKRMVSSTGTSLETPYYILYAKEIVSAHKKHEAETLCTEVSILIHKWISRGLDINTIRDITIRYAPSCGCFPIQFEVSQFDSCDWFT